MSATIEKSQLALGRLVGCFIRSEQVTFKAELVGGVGVNQVKGGDHRVPGYSLEARAERGHGETAFLPPRTRAGVAFCRTSRAVRRTRNRERSKFFK